MTDYLCNFVPGGTFLYTLVGTAMKIGDAKSVANWFLMIYRKRRWNKGDIAW